MTYHHNSPARASLCQPSCLAVVVPGMYATVMNDTAVTEARQCPQKFYCPGGTPLAAVNPAMLSSLNPAEATIKQCPDGMWTPGQQAASVEECCKC
jgi:hypothetical protein